MWAFTVRGSWRLNITAIFWPPNLWPSALWLSCSLDAQPGPWGQLCWVLAFFTASYQHLHWTPTSAWCGFPYHISTPTVWNSTGNSTRTRTQLRYIMVQRPLDLWNRMFDRHQAEITVMQFTCHSLPVHQSMSVPWEFFFFFLARPISSANFHPRDFLS